MARQRIAYKTPPRKLTPKVHKDIITAIDAGLRFVVDWCGYAGISTTSFDRWGELAATDEPGADAASCSMTSMKPSPNARRAICSRCRWLARTIGACGVKWSPWSIRRATGQRQVGNQRQSDHANCAFVGDSDADANHAAETP